MKNYETSIYWEKGWALGFWIMRGWFAAQCFSLKIVVSKKCEPIEPIEFADMHQNLVDMDELKKDIGKAFFCN